MIKTGNFLKIKNSVKIFNKICAKISVSILKQRISLGKTQKEFAEYMGVTQGMISKWESGDYNFTVSSIADIFDKLDLDFDFDIKPRKNNKVVKYDFKFKSLDSKTNLTEISEMAG